MALDMAMVRKGNRDSTRAVNELGETAFANATTYKSILVKHGLPEAWFTQMPIYLELLKEARGTQAEMREESIDATRAEGSVYADAKKLVRRIKTAGELALRDAPIAGVTLDTFKRGTVGKTAAEVADYLAKLRPAVALADEALKQYFEQKSALAELDRTHSALVHASGEQEAKRARAPVETQALYEVQGKIIDLVERLNLVARIAFDGQAELLAIFNKDILLRYRRSRAGAARKSSDAQTDQPAKSEVPSPA
jgi:hypothetical protein